MARTKRYKGATRDGSGFVALPHMLLDSPAYADLSHPARALLIEVARQFRGDNNGRMLLSRAHLEQRGWKSADVIQRAKKELLDAGLIHETRMGHRPNKASWYACTWMPLDKLDGYDVGAALLFERSAYLKRGAVLIPPHGTERPPIAPPHGTASAPPVPSHGAIRALSTTSPVPSDGHLSREPSPRASGPAVGAVDALGIQAVSAGGPSDAIALAAPQVGTLLEQLQRRIGGAR
jgi:hypothetical protein